MLASSKFVGNIADMVITEEEFRALKTECAQHLGSDLAEAFICLMANTDLGSTRLVKWATAFKSAELTTASMTGKKLYPTTVLTWLKKLYSTSALKERKARMEVLKKNDRFQYFVGQYQLVCESNGALVATLIIVFEHKTETLVHHLIKTSANAEVIWYVIHNAHQQALRKTGPKGKDLNHFILRQPDIDIFRLISVGVARNACWTSPTLRPDDPLAKREGKSSTAKVAWARQQFEIEKTHWEGQTFSSVISLTERDIGNADHAMIHKTLQAAAGKVTKHFQKRPKYPHLRLITPSWTTLSRARKSIPKQ